MALIAGTNTYATAVELSSYATARGLEIAGESDVLLVGAMDYLATLEDRWQGERKPDQPEV